MLLVAHFGGLGAGQVALNTGLLLWTDTFSLLLAHRTFFSRALFPCGRLVLSQASMWNLTV
jgi:hypothetical protein